MAETCLHHINKRAASNAIIGVVLLICGCAIYLLFRSKTLKIYQWLSSLGLSDTIDFFRDKVLHWDLSDFIKYSLPDGMYSAAYIFIIDAIWNEDKGIVKNIFILIVPLAAIFNEILQFFALTKGTFDMYDLICYTIPILIYILFNGYNSLNLLKSKNV